MYGSAPRTNAGPWCKHLWDETHFYPHAYTHAYPCVYTQACLDAAGGQICMFKHTSVHMSTLMLVHEQAQILGDEMHAPMLVNDFFYFM